MKNTNLPPKSSKFDFLTEAEMAQLVDVYYNQKESIKSIIETFKLPIANSIESHFPWIPSNQLCTYCGDQMFSKPHHRNWKPNTPTCYNCQHKNEHNCNCSKCWSIRNEAAEKAKQEKHNLILEYLKKQSESKIDFYNLSAEERISLGILIRYGSSEDLTHLLTFKTIEHWNKNKFFILPLIKSKILTININSDFNCIRIKKNKFNEVEMRTDFHTMKWDINVDKDGMTTNELFQYLAKPTDFYKLTGEQIYKYWQKMANDEAQKYLEHRFEQILKIPYCYSLPIQKLLEFLTNHFSIGQIYNLIWKYSNNTLGYKTERGYMTAEHVHNYLLKSITIEAEKIIKNNYKLEHFEKPKYIGKSIFTDFFFQFVLKQIGQEYRLTPGYFIEKYNLNNIKDEENKMMENKNFNVENSIIIEIDGENDGDPFWLF